jgi:hypothetical protein
MSRRPNLATVSIAVLVIMAFVGAAAAEPGKGRGGGGGGGPAARPAPAPPAAGPRVSAPAPRAPMMARPAPAPRAMPQAPRAMPQMQRAMPQRAMPPRMAQPRAMPQRAMPPRAMSRPAPALRQSIGPRNAGRAPRPEPRVASPRSRPDFMNRAERRALQREQAAQPRINARDRAAERNQLRQQRAADRLQLREQQAAERLQRRQTAVQNRIERLQQRAERGRLSGADRRALRRLERVQRQLGPTLPAIARDRDRDQRQGARREARVTPQQAARERFAANFINTNADRGPRRFERAGRLAAPLAWRRGWRAAYVPWLGAIYWPYAYSDLFYYAFWPDAYEPGYWAFAYDDLYDGIFFPDGAPYIDYAYQGPYYQSAEVRLTTGSSRSSARAPATPGRLDRATRAFCAEQAKGITTLPFERIEQAVRPTNDQRALFADLKKAAAEAAAQFREACPENVPLTPLGRLEAMTMRLEAARDAIKIMRPALAAFYQSLDNEQKAAFNEIGPDLAREPRTAQNAASCQGGKAGLAALPIERIEAIVQPVQTQQAALASLQDAIEKSVTRLSEACPLETPATPVARLDAMQRRIDAMLAAAQEIRPALEAFYASLDDEQKAKFNRLSRVTAQSRQAD